MRGPPRATAGTAGLPADREGSLPGVRREPPRGDLSDSHRRHRGAREALRLQRLHDEGELVNLLPGQLIELEILEQMNAVHYQHDLVHGQRELGIRVHPVLMITASPPRCVASSFSFPWSEVSCARRL